jgi:predicted aspartyl protease
MTGRIENLKPLIVLPAGSANGVFRDVEFIVDTGSNGEASITDAIEKDLELNDEDHLYVMEVETIGGHLPFRVCLLRIKVGMKDHIVEAWVGSFTTIGMRLLERVRAHLEMDVIEGGPFTLLFC